jgi:hypothetical protein
MCTGSLIVLDRRGDEEGHQDAEGTGDRMRAREIGRRR